MMDEELSLVGFTEDMNLNAVFFGFLGLFQMVFPGRLQACYLLGSHATSEAVGESDIDLTLVFKGRFQPGERRRFEHFRRHVSPLSPLSLDANAVEEEQLLEEGAVNLKKTSLLLMGEDLRERIPLMPLDAWIRYCMHRPYVFMERARARAEGEPLRFPLIYPDPRGELYGYDHREVLDAQGQSHRGFKELVTLACRLATAEVAVKAGGYTYSKREAIEAHRELVNDAWTPLYEQIYAARKRWGYRVPEAAADVAHLRSLCEGMLEAENHFLGLYKGFLLEELRRGAVKDRVLAAQRLGEIAYPGDEVPAALRALAQAPEEELREAAAESLRRLGPSGT
ncbi:hypothetical protein [Corallococcus sp. AB032C]|uniref:hypothetical protein n=2 Tax=Corallococcus TaxID=83461 RepID=UPI0011C3479E|nr:hypothetical protein [Corallococcus sp. AB032C]